MGQEEMPLSASWRMVQGNCLTVLGTIPDDGIDAVITDPPYASGGFSRDDKNREIARVAGKNPECVSQKNFRRSWGFSLNLRKSCRR
jgi:DNA modification methylase